MIKRNVNIYIYFFEKNILYSIYFYIILKRHGIKNLLINSGSLWQDKNN